MEVHNRDNQNDSKKSALDWRRLLRGAAYYLTVTLCLLSIFHSSLLVTSQPLRPDELESLDRAIDLLDAKGFGREAFLLRRVTVFRNSDNWLNAMTDKDNAYAATNFPFNVVTLYPDFFTKATDDTERAMVLLHEAQHLQGADEPEAYGYVWRHRAQLGWTMLTHGTTESYVTIEILTREIAPGLFTCTDKIWKDCTESLPAAKPALAKAE